MFHRWKMQPVKPASPHRYTICGIIGPLVGVLAVLFGLLTIFCWWCCFPHYRGCLAVIWGHIHSKGQTTNRMDSTNRAGTS